MIKRDDRSPNIRSLLAGSMRYLISKNKILFRKSIDIKSDKSQSLGGEFGKRNARKMRSRNDASVVGDHRGTAGEPLRGRVLPYMVKKAGIGRGCHVLIGGVELGGGPLYFPVHIIHCNSPTGYILCLVLDWSTVRQSVVSRQTS